MKTRTLCSVALLAILGANVALPVAASADAKNLTSTGHIEYEEDTTVTPPIDHEKPEEELDDKDEIVKNPDGGSLAIDAVTKLQFMKQKAVTTDQRYYAKQVPADKNGVSDGFRGNFVQVTDKRIDSRTPWTLTAKLNKQFTTGDANDATNVLAGSTITYTNPTINGKGDDKSLFPVLGSKASTFTLSFDKTNGGNTINVMGTKTAEQGFGTFTIGFGNTAGFEGADKGKTPGLGVPTPEDSTGTPDSDPKKQDLIHNGSVQLFVPGNAIKKKAAYEAEVLWSIATTPID
ncbi:WxL domain-containing protein [Candidatus Enterococcus mansonii]|uniref:WxL domain-containing protein n=1 Tax=Candidatus Enterococcus mansonii TaxID=1834181 RepID=A0A242CEV5_9ENTE|nr:WxL domain-containing protein [Enterococcus sp. 4G2_DIV0659]OTO08767.1 hypothetical protein A5880_001767 [Enterococcus sp. 4G2_DIV0659]